MLRKAPAEAVWNSVENCRNTLNTNSYILHLKNWCKYMPWSGVCWGKSDNTNKKGSVRGGPFEAMSNRMDNV